jgi:succinate dehydrogenase/fumarate reductase flavoprotein subunit
MMVARADIPHFRRFATSWTSTFRVARLIVRHLRERLSHPRGTSLVLGNALVGRLMLSAMNAGVQLRRNVSVKSLVLDNGRCCGVRLAEAAADKVISSRRGVVLATGGFSHDVELRHRFMPAVASEVSATVGVATGDGLRLAEAAGAAILTDMIDPALWVPVSRYAAADGRDVIYPHTVTDRAKPGAIAVDLSGRRFVNEAASYHEFVRAMLHSPNRAAMRAYLICDSRFIWRYGLGAIAPFTLRRAPYVQAGYLKVADDLEGLASGIGIDAAALRSTVRSFNEGAAHGKDPEYGRGGDDYQRHLGDADQKPNPCVAPILKPPFYAVELRPGDLGTAVGLSTDEKGRVLSSTGDPVPGLYAVGNDAASIMRGHYPGPGITLGPALTHGYLVAKSVAESGAE